MLEELCRSYFSTKLAEYSVCSLVRLKGAPKPKSVVQDDFFTRLSSYHEWNVFDLNKIMRKKIQSIERQSWFWFNDNADKIFDAYIKAEYCGNAVEVFSKHETFEQFFDEFTQYFNNRRVRFLENMQNDINANLNVAIENGAKLAKTNNRMPQSHGGVANLLKILTKTMFQQGSSIQTVAKVQYAICMQAGILIPSEFLTDVLVAEEMMEEVE